jgi:hypothetical protein
LSADQVLDTPPTFLVIGAARSGTTALTRTLSQHPEIFITEPKETHFFAFANSAVHFNGPGDDRMMNERLVTDAATYVRLYSDARDIAHRGEGSVSTLFYARTSIPNIRRYAPNVKLVVSLRNPTDRAYSSYLYLRSRGFETLPTFEQGLAAEAERTRAGWHHMWQYLALGHYAAQLQPFIDAFGRERLEIVVHDDYRSHPRRTLDHVVDFLGAPRHEFDTSREWNRGGIPKNQALRKSIDVLHRSTRATRLVRRRVPKQRRDTVKSALLDRPPMNPRTRSELHDLYAPGITALETLIDRDLSAWQHHQP